MDNIVRTTSCKLYRADCIVQTVSCEAYRADCIARILSRRLCCGITLLSCKMRLYRMIELHVPKKVMMYRLDLPLKQALYQTRRLFVNCLEELLCGISLRNKGRLRATTRYRNSDRGGTCFSHSNCKLQIGCVYHFGASSLSGLNLNRWRRQKISKSSLQICGFLKVDLLERKTQAAADCKNKERAYLQLGQQKQNQNSQLHRQDNEADEGSKKADTYGGGTMKPAPFWKNFPLSRRPTTNHQHQMIISG